MQDIIQSINAGGASSKLFVHLVVITVGFFSCNNGPAKHENHFKSQSEPGASDEIYWNSLPTNQTVISKQMAIAPEADNMNLDFRGNGYITFDYRRNKKLSVRFAGRIEKLFVKYNYQYVRQGEKIMELYSPEISTYTEELLYVTRNNDTALQARAKEKLRLLGLTPMQIHQILKSRNVPATISIYSPYEGFVLFDPSMSLGMSTDKENESLQEMGGEMNAGNDVSVAFSQGQLSDKSVREGMYVNKGQTIFWINDFRMVLGIVSFTKENDKHVRRGLPITVISELTPEKELKSSIVMVEQIYRQGQKLSQARVYLPNSNGIFKANSLISATVSIPARSLTVPAGSVYYLGKEAIVWVKVGVTNDGSNIFQSRLVQVGDRINNRIQVLEGLSSGENVARDAAYLADSEAIIQY